MNIKNIRKIALNSVIEYFYSKFFYLILFFLIILVFMSVLIGILAVDEEKKVLMDFFVSINQIVLFLFSVFFGSLSLQNDIETKRIYLILSRPVSVIDYILGRLKGIYVSSFFLSLFMFLLSYLILFLKGYYNTGADYIYRFINVYIQIIIISSFAMLFTSITTSPFTSVVISSLLWLLSNFVSELKFVLNRIEGISYWFLKLIFYLIPDFSIMKIEVKNGIFYFIIYITVLLILNVNAFKNKEF